MKRLIFGAIALLFSACSTDITEDVAVVYPDKLTVTFEEDTRIQLGEDGKTVWTNGDLVSLFYRSDANQQWKFEGETGARTAELVKIAEPESTTTISKTVLIYPYSEDYVIDTESCAVTATMPAVQNYQKDSFGVGSSIMVAQSENNQFQLKNVCGWLMLQLTGNGEVVKSIELKGNRNEQVAGQITINSANATATLAESSTDTAVTLVCSEDVTLAAEPTTFYIALPPQTFEGGLTAKIYCADDSVMTKSTINSLTISRNTILPMEAIGYQEDIPCNQIRYTASAKVSPKSTAFNVAVKSNEWDSSTGIGIITFEGDVTEIEEEAFYYNSSIKTIQLPESVTTIGDKALYQCENLTKVDMPQSVTYIGKEAFFYCIRLKSLELPQNLTVISDRCFAYCTSLFSAQNNILNIPDSVEKIEDCAFYGCQAIYSLNLGKGLKSIGVDAFNTCCKFTSLTIPSNVKEIGEGAFMNCYIISDLTIEEGVESLGRYAFRNIKQLKSVELPASIKSIGEEAFYKNPLLESVTCKTTTPISAVYSQAWEAFDKCSENLKIYVPESKNYAVIRAYQLAAGWCEYADRIVTVSGSAPKYESVDTSVDGEVVTIQTATEGNGIDIVLMGEGYSDRLIADNIYDRDMRSAVDKLFSMEPFKSFKKFFNIYYVKAVSKHEGYASGNTTKFGCIFGDGSSISGDINLMMTYAQKAISAERMNNATIITIMNAHKVAGVCTLMIPNNKETDYGCGIGVAILSQGSNDADFLQLVCHEAGGHGFAKLADEYVETIDMPSESALETIASQSSYGWLKNIDVTKDPETIKWANFLKDSRYENIVGIYLGGYTYGSKVWRPSENSIMNNRGADFNAPSREAIYYRIHKLAYGADWVYNYEDFAEYDAINRNATAEQAAAHTMVLRIAEPTTPPIIIKKTWSEVLDR